MEEIKTIGLTFVNAYLLKVKENFILVDTGLAMHHEKLESELTSAGCLPDRLKLVILTHGDLDHTGNCAMLQKKYGCKIAMHEGDVPMVRDGVMIRRKVRSLQSRIFFLIRKLFRKKFVFDSFSPDILLTEGQRLNDYGLDAIVIHIPGHTKGSIGILTAEGNLFAGDTFTNRKKPATANLIENQDELNESLSRIKNMDIKMVYPGHGSPFDMKLISGKF
ncbi:MAG: MBL fold metallo-hydrolase [Bacteroidales bacterium]|jgi:glyoxylase-like metal-dependent hydrolase (beta-lactamase superfamily II)